MFAAKSWAPPEKHSKHNRRASVMKLFQLIFVGLALLVVPASACLWDRDTLDQERRRFPSILELITGHFLRHSPEFYQWRITDRERQLQAKPDAISLYDDLAVAHEKLGNYQKAIDLMLEKDRLKPGQYETSANLGTFYLHSGQYEKGLAEIHKAIAINPDAHFGREIYQARLVEYLLSRPQQGQPSTDGFTLPLDDSAGSPHQPRGFAAYLARLIVDQTGESEDDVDFDKRQEAIQVELSSALKGVTGMMRFGNFDSPILLESLADLLLAQGFDADAKQLAARAYLKASYETDGVVSSNYRQLAEQAIEMQVTQAKGNQQMQLTALERQFQAELKEAESWFDATTRSEKAWIQNGINPEVEFDKAYPADPQLDTSSLTIPVLPSSPVRPVWHYGIFALGPIGLFLLWKKAKQK